MLAIAGFYHATACNATHGIAVGILSVRPSVCLSVRCVYCDKTKQRTANILIPHETAISLVLFVFCVSRVCVSNADLSVSYVSACAGKLDC